MRRIPHPPPLTSVADHEQSGGPSRTFVPCVMGPGSPKHIDSFMCVTRALVWVLDLQYTPIGRACKCRQHSPSPSPMYVAHHLSSGGTLGPPPVGRPSRSESNVSPVGVDETVHGTSFPPPGRAAHASVERVATEAWRGPLCLFVQPCGRTI